MPTPTQAVYSRTPQTVARATEQKQPPQPANAPQPIDAELLKLVGGAGTQLPVNRW